MPKAVQIRSESLCANLRAPRRIFWAWFGPALGPNPARKRRFPAGFLKAFGAKLKIGPPAGLRPAGRGTRAQEPRRGGTCHVSISGRNKYRYHLDHRYRADWHRAGFFRFCATPVVLAKVFPGRRPAKTFTGTTGIAQSLKNRCGTH